MSRKPKYCFLTPGTFFSLMVLLVALVGGKTLPASWGQENGPIEWLQVVILGMVSLAALLAAFFGSTPSSRRKLFLWSVPVWLLAIGRELSWGRTFYSNQSGGLIDQAHLWYSPYVNPLVACIIVITVWGLLKHGLPSEVRSWFKFGTVPILEIFILFGAAFMAEWVEHYSSGIFGVNEELYEELAEAVYYSTLLFLIVDLGFYKKIQPIKTAVYNRLVQ